MKKKDEIDMKQPMMVSSHDVKLDAEYAEWIAEVKHRYRSAQVKAAVKVNAEKLLWNWQMGRDLVQKKAEERWGAGVVEQVSLDLKREFPNETGFSARNLWYMKQWYLFYISEGEESFLHQVGAEMQKLENQYSLKLHQPGAELDGTKLYQPGKEMVKQPVSELPLPFALVPWKHHVEIITKCETIEKALFYVGKTIEQGLSRDALINCIKARLYETQGKIVNNFSEHLPELQSKLMQEVLKENYDFGFATVGHEVYDEDELEAALTENVTNLLIEMGNGFAFLGKQREIIVGGRSRKIDLLFYHIRLRCYVVCELKAKPFEPEFAGKLNFYVNAVDELKKAPDDNPTIGLLICSDMNKTEVQWSFKGISTPMGVATYNNIRIKDMLPTQEQLKERMELLKKELKHTKRLMNKNSPHGKPLFERHSLGAVRDRMVNLMWPDETMRKLLTILFLMITLVAQAQRQQISYIEETKNWYYIYDEKGKRIGGLSRSSVGELKGWGSDFFVAKRYSYYHICDAKGRTLKTMNVSDVGEIVAVTNSTITSRKGSWIFTWSKEGKKISARSKN